MYLRVRHRGARVPGAVRSVLRPYNLEAENLVYVQSTTTKESLMVSITHFDYPRRMVREANPSTQNILIHHYLKKMIGSVKCNSFNHCSIWSG